MAGDSTRALARYMSHAAHVDAVAGKVRLALVPVNHYWNVTLYLTPRGLTTLAMPYRDRAVGMTFDFVDHQLRIDTSDGQRREVALAPRSVADFYAEAMARLQELGVAVKIWPMPVEIEKPIRFVTRSPESVLRSNPPPRSGGRSARTEAHGFHGGRFVGKSSPVHFFWGSFDLAVTRFSGRRAPSALARTHYARGRTRTRLSAWVRPGPAAWMSRCSTTTPPPSPRVRAAPSSAGPFVGNGPDAS